MSVSLKASADGTQAILAVNGADKLTVNSDGSVVASASPANGDNTKKLATTEFIQGSVLGGVGQSLQDVTASRAVNTTYYNTTGRPIMVYLRLPNFGGTIRINGVDILEDSIAYGYMISYAFMVPTGASYAVNLTAGSLGTWKEIR